MRHRKLQLPLGRSPQGHPASPTVVRTPTQQSSLLYSVSDPDPYGSVSFFFCDTFRNIHVPGGSWKPLGTSGGVLGGAAGIPEGSGSRLEGLLVPNGSHFGTLLGSLFGTFFWDRVWNTFFSLIFNDFGVYFGVVF